MILLYVEKKKTQTEKTNQKTPSNIIESLYWGRKNPNPTQEKTTKTLPNNRNEKELPEGKNLKQVNKGKHKTYEEWKRDID